LTAFSAATATAETHWQVQGANITVVAAGGKAIAVQSAETIARLRQIVGWEVGWPESYQPPAVLAFALHKDTIEEFFGKPRTPQDDYLAEFRTAGGLSVALGTTTVIVFPIRGDRGSEVDGLKLLYVRTLLDNGPTQRWPQCVRFGLGVAATSAHTTHGDELYVPTDEVRFILPPSESALAPIDLMGPDIPASEDVGTRTRRGYSCYVLAMMALRGESFGRSAYNRYFEAIADGRPFHEAAQSSFGVDETEFIRQMKAFGNRMNFQPRPLAIRVKLPAVIPTWSEPQPLTEERVSNTLLALRGKIFGPSTATGAN
jgi:hypothetical protein